MRQRGRGGARRTPSCRQCVVDTASRQHPALKNKWVFFLREKKSHPFKITKIILSISLSPHCLVMQQLPPISFLVCPSFLAFLSAFLHNLHISLTRQLLICLYILYKSFWIWLLDLEVFMARHSPTAQKPERVLPLGFTAFSFFRTTGL